MRIDCSGGDRCDDVTDSFIKYKGEDISRDDFLNVLKFEMTKRFYKKFNFSIEILE